MLSSDAQHNTGPKRTDISYKKYMDSFSLLLKKVFLLVAGLLAGISLVYIIFVLANANNLENTHRVILRLDQISYILSLLSFTLCINITLAHQEKHIDVLKMLEIQRINVSKRKHAKNVVLSSLYGAVLGLVLIDHRFMVALSSKPSLGTFKEDSPLIFYLFLALKVLIFILVISAWIFVICAKRRPRSRDAK